MKTLYQVLTILIIIIWEKGGVRGNSTASRRSPLAIEKAEKDLEIAREAHFIAKYGWGSDDVLTPATDRMYTPASSYGSGSWRNAFGLFSRAPQYPVNDGTYGSYGNAWGARQYINPAPYLRSAPTPYQYYSRPSSPTAPAYPGHDEQGWKTAGKHPYPYESPEIDDTSASESVLSEYKIKGTTEKGRRPSAPTSSDDDEVCECASDDDSDTDEAECDCESKTKERRVNLKERKHNKNKHSKSVYKKLVTRKPCKYGFNSGPHGGCKPKPTTPSPSESEYSEDEDSEEEFPLNCDKNDLKCIQKHIYRISTEEAGQDSDDEPSHRPHSSRGKRKSAHKRYANSYKLKGSTTRSTEDSDTHKSRPSSRQRDPEPEEEEEMEDSKDSEEHHEKSSDVIRTTKNSVKHQKFTFDPKTGKFELEKDEDQLPAQTQSVVMEVVMPTPQSLKPTLIQPESFPTAEPLSIISPTSSIQQVGSFSQMQMANQNNPQSLAPLIGKLLSQGPGIQFPTLNHGGTEYTIQPQSGNTGAYSVQPKQLFGLAQNQAPFSLQPQASQLNSLSDVQVAQINQALSGQQQHFVQPQVTVVDSLPTQQEKSQYIYQSQEAIQNSAFQTQQANNQNIFQPQGQSQNSPQLQTWGYQNSIKPQGQGTSQYSTIQIQQDGTQRVVQSQVPSQPQQPSFQSSGQPQQTSFQNSLQPQQTNFQSSIQPQATIQNSPYSQSAEVQTSLQPQWATQPYSHPQIQTASTYPVQSQGVTQNNPQQQLNYPQPVAAYPSQQPTPATGSHFTSQSQGVSQPSYHPQTQQFGQQNPSEQQLQAESQFSQYYPHSKSRSHYSQTSPQSKQATQYNSQSQLSFAPEQFDHPQTQPHHSPNHETRGNDDEYVSFFSQEPKIINLNSQTNPNLANEQPPEIIYEPRSKSESENHSESRNFRDPQQESASSQVVYGLGVEKNKSNPHHKGKTDCEVLREYHETLNLPPIDQIRAEGKEINHNSYERPSRGRPNKKVQGRFARKETSEKVFNIGPLPNYQASASDNLYNAPEKAESPEAPNLNIAIHLHNFTTTGSGQKKENIKVNANDVMDTPKAPVKNRKGKEFSGYESLDYTYDTPVVEDEENETTEQPQSLEPQLYIEEVGAPHEERDNATVEPTVEGQVPQEEINESSSSSSIYNSTVNIEPTSAAQIALSSSLAVERS